MPRKKKESLDNESTVIEIPQEIILPYNELWQNVNWYIKVSGKKITYEDLSKHHYTEFDQYKDHIDKL